jgi:hypothetical protein
MQLNARRSGSENTRGVVRSLPLQYGAIRIASLGGVQRRIRVSGLVKARFLWLFRNFYILDFAVLSRKQQQLIAQLWNSRSSTASKEAAPSKTSATVDDADAVPDLSALELIGTVEGYLPQLYPAPVAAKFHVGDRIVIPHPYRLRIILPMGVRLTAIWTATAVLLLGGAITLGPNALGTKSSGPVPQSASPVHVAASAAANPAPSTPPVPAKPSLAPAPPSVAEAAVPAADAPGLQPAPLPDAMASNASLADMDPELPRVAVGSRLPATTAPASSSATSSATHEVTIRVTVDREGRAQEFQFLQGDPKRVSAALHAAKRFSFQPCADSADCDHLLKFIDFGDASLVQRID